MKREEREKFLTILTVFFVLISPIIAETNQTKLEGSCLTDAECSSPYIVCKNQKCKHKGLFPLRFSEIMGMIIILVLCLLAAVAGIGGGTLIIPIALLMMDFSTKEAIALSNGLIFFAGVAKYCVALTRKHVNLKYKTVIDYNISLTFIPLLIFGSYVGSNIASIMPNFLQLIGLIIVSLFSMYSTYTKGVKMWKKENEEKKQREIERQGKELLKKESIQIESAPKEKKSEGSLNDDQEEKEKIKGPVPQNNGDLPMTNLELDTLTGNNDESKLNIRENTKIQKLIEKNEGNNFYCKKFSIIALTMILVLSVVFFKGSKGVKSLISINKCETSYWIMMISYLILTLFLMVAANKIVLNDQKLKEKYEWPHFQHPDEKKFTKGFVIKANIAGFLGGFISSIVGVASGMITNPIMLSMHYIPQVVSFTGMFPTMLDKFVITLILVLTNEVPIDFLLFAGIILGVGVVLIEWKMITIIRKIGRESIIAIVFVGVLFIGLALTVYVGALNTIKTVREGRSLFEFKNYCK